MISQHPEVEQKVVAELDSLSLLATPDQPDPRPMEHADLQELKYTLQAIKVMASPEIRTKKAIR